MEQQDLLTDIEVDSTKRRRALLPLWVKVFVWIFLFFGAMVPIILIMGMTGSTVSLSLYGIDSTDPFSVNGGIILTIFTLKAVVAYGLWQGKPWAITLGIIDGILGIAICAILMFYPLIFPAANFPGTFRLELLPLTFYLYFLVKVRAVW